MTLDAGYFDDWYADMSASPARDAIMARALGVSGVTGVLPWRGLADVTDALRLEPGGLLLDIACGRGAYGVEIAQRTGARLIGVDFSAVALEQAAQLSADAEFRLGTLTETGLPTGTANGLICLDSVQFAAPPLAALTEFHRLLVPGGRVVLTGWEAVDDRAPDRIRAVNLARDLPEAGFVDVEVHDKPDWRAAERTMWEDALTAPATDAAVRSLQDEGRRSLETFGSLRRVFATATALRSRGVHAPRSDAG
ncbi:class I SAM-dependent methyltransferase [Cryptosporangium sp. NPDC048952]|uniref:class I SAM-dependent methyltransferase n=1 Tax=Cryptosporangium sp. NPDC048952 TaxID=3363961 RepID=UPI0037112A76